MSVLGFAVILALVTLLAVAVFLVVVALRRAAEHAIALAGEPGQRLEASAERPAVEILPAAE